MVKKIWIIALVILFVNLTLPFPALATVTNSSTPAYIWTNSASTTVDDQHLMAGVSNPSTTFTGAEISYLVQAGDTGLINWFDSSNTFISSSTISMSGTSGTNVSITPPSGASYAQLELTSGSISGYRYLWYDQATNSDGNETTWPAPDTSNYVNNSTPTVQSLTVSPSSASVQVGHTQAFTATAHYSDGSSSDVTSSASWTSSDTSVATMSGNVVSGVSAGTSTISATYGGFSGSGTITVTATAPTLQSITVSPSTTSIQVGGTVYYTAMAHYSDGSQSSITSAATWSSSDTSVATLSANDATGEAAGTCTITAAYGGMTGTASLTVTAASAPTLESLSVSPDTATIDVGGTQAFTATAHYSDGSTSDVHSSATWTSSDTGVATISGATATGVTAGSSTITATYDGTSGTAALTVSTPPPPPPPPCNDTL
ncbi:bacterial Ig-like domain (group 2) [Peptococcaceae bacterium CEB3]|nr:bacterial Ig-like domain (group 2) [Peptococcaceae bacterium CEB3]